MNDYTPESITREGDSSGIIVSKIKFYPEDIEKLKNLNSNDAITYKAKLIKSGKYTLDWN